MSDATRRAVEDAIGRMFPKPNHPTPQKPPTLSPAFMAEMQRVVEGTRAGMLATAARLEAGLAAAEGMAPEKRRAMVRVVAWLRERAA